MLLVPFPSLKANAQERDLKRLAADLHLTPAGAHQWLTVLGVDPGRPAPERLLAVTVANRVVATRDGGAEHVTLGTDLDLQLLRPESDLVLVHNHPNGVGLSGDDLIQLEKPGVAAVAAVGHDGSLYLAGRGRRFDRDFFEPAQYSAARAAALKAIRDALASGALTSESVDRQFAHVVSLALARAGVITYQADLSSARRSDFENTRAVFGPVISLAASRVR
jgi:hypothetical protein